MFIILFSLTSSGNIYLKSDETIEISSNSFLLSPILDIRGNITNKDTLLEIGPGTVLTNLVKRTAKDAEVYSISKVDDIEILKNINS